MGNSKERSGTKKVRDRDPADQPEAQHPLSITRHDILNQVTAVVMYLSLTEEIVKDKEVTANLKKSSRLPG